MEFTKIKEFVRAVGFLMCHSVIYREKSLLLVFCWFSALRDRINPLGLYEYSIFEYSNYQVNQDQDGKFHIQFF